MVLKVTDSVRRPMAEPRRVVLATSFDWPKPGGLERVVEVELRELVQRGHDVHLVCSRSDQDPVAHMGMDRIGFHRRPYRYVSFVPGFVLGLWFAFSARGTLRRLAKDPDAVVHAHNTYAALAALLAGVHRKTALHLHSVSSQDYKTSEAADRPLGARVLAAIDTWACVLFEMLTYNVVGRVLCVSEQEHRDAVRKVKRLERLKLVRNGVDTTRFRPDPAARAEVRNRLGIGADETVVLFVGRFVPKNGTLVIARAAKRVDARGARARWVFVGAGSEEPGMREALSGMENVLFLPPQPSGPLYAMADVFVSHVTSSLEGHGLTVLEAMATGVATVSGTDSIKEACFAGGDDLLLVPKDDDAPLADALERLVRDPALRAALGKGGREKTVRDFSIETQVDRILAELRALSPARRG